MDAVTGPQYLRVKELFESLEAFSFVSSVILTAENQGRAIGTIYDLCCGHGLLGTLLAYRFPRKRVVCVDLEERPGFHVLRQAWVAHGTAFEGEEAPLSNLEYVEGDLKDAVRDAGEASCMVSIHACNDANQEVVEGARAAGGIWAVMPCCIRKGSYLPSCSLELCDDTRYRVLVGGFANANQAQLIRSIDPLITARPIIIAGGLPRPTAETWEERQPASRQRRPPHARAMPPAQGPDAALEQLPE